MEFPAFHRRIYEATREVCARYDLWLAGGYAIRAHSLVERASQDLDFATIHSAPLPEIAYDVAAALAAAGLNTRQMGGDNAERTDHGERAAYR
ncbi:MAG: hypothetical protein GEU94_03015 [Micromonosporaceae bacterium]|nr:hypothetical protein [Micromonosporaceae bacterium]